jgi:hypothetical protein
MALRQGLRSLGSRLVQGQQFAPLQSIAAHLPFSLQNDDGSALPGPVSSTMGSRRCEYVILLFHEICCFVKGLWFGCLTFVCVVLGRVCL